MDPNTVTNYMELFQGRTDAFGTGRGQWIKRPPVIKDFQEHLAGRGPGLGIAPLLDDGTIRFAAIDLDEPDFDAAQEMQELLGFATTWIERSRSGNAHVWAFFSDWIPAWIPRGILRETTAAIGKPSVEVFPKQDRLLEGMVGNYINLPYHGNDRPMVAWDLGDEKTLTFTPEHGVTVDWFVDRALAQRNDPAVWQKRANWLGIAPPEQRENQAEPGTGKNLHKCAEHIIANRDENPILEGARNVVYFHLAKMLAHYEGFDHDDSWEMLRLVRDSADEQGVEHFPDSELRRILGNAERGGFTSTGCDDPMMQPYVHPDCPIGKGLR